MAGWRKPSSAEPTPLNPNPTGGQFLLQLLQKPSSTPSTPPSPSDPLPLNPYPHLHDPAVAAVGPSHPVPPWSTDQLRPLSPYPLPSSLFPPVFPQNPWPLLGFHPPPSVHGIDAFDFRNSPQFPSNPPFNSFQQFGFPRNGDAVISGQHIPPLPPLQQQMQDGILPDNVNTLTFGSLKCDLSRTLPNGNSTDLGGGKFKGPLIRPHEKGTGSPWVKPHRGGHQRSGVVENRRLPLPSLPQPGGQLNRPKGQEEWVSVNGRRDGGRRLEKEDEIPVRQRLNDHSTKLPLTVQMDNPGPPTGSNLHSVPAADMEDSLRNLKSEVVVDGRSSGIQRLDRMSNPPDGGEVVRDRLSEVTGSLVVGVVGDEEVKKNDLKQKDPSGGKDRRLDTSRGLQFSNQRMRNRRKEIACRSDVERLSPCFLSIYESLIPPDEEKAKQKQLLASLEKLVNKEWPRAQLYLYGSCANSFGVSNSDIDVCMALDDDDISKPDILLKLAEILESDNLQNVQALTRARVPIVKLMDPVTRISCDICINNVLAVVNTKLLRDYAQIDLRLRQLAFIVKHWAKSRGVNETYHGTLSSYAYVLMCIHFLQMRRPAILPCLQEMKATYVVNVDDVECAYFDRVEELHDFGAHNKESLAHLLWAFFDYWAYRHDYANTVISVRTGCIISKRAKDWTRRIGNDRHLICIEDPFEINHDLGRVVDKYSIKILREEFERAADVLQYDPHPNIKLFEPYIPS